MTRGGTLFPALCHFPPSPHFSCLTPQLVQLPLSAVSALFLACTELPTSSLWASYLILSRSYFFLYRLLLRTDLGLIILNVSLQLTCHPSLLPASPGNYPTDHTPASVVIRPAEQHQALLVPASCSLKHHGGSANFPPCACRKKWYNWAGMFAQQMAVLAPLICFLNT